jgi:hypothetical protein
VRDTPSFEEEKRRREEALGQPSDKHFAKTAMVGTATSGGAAVAGGMLARGADHEPDGWRDVKMDPKYNVWHGSVRKDVLQTLKVSVSLGRAGSAPLATR